MLPWHHGQRLQIRHADDIGITALPAGEAQVGHQVFGNVPAKDHIALRESLLDAVQKERGGDALAAIRAVQVGAADLDRMDAMCCKKRAGGGKVHSTSS